MGINLTKILLGTWGFDTEERLTNKQGEIFDYYINGILNDDVWFKKIKKFRTIRWCLEKNFEYTLEWTYEPWEYLKTHHLYFVLTNKSQAMYYKLVWGSRFT